MDKKTIPKNTYRLIFIVCIMILLLIPSLYAQSPNAGDKEKPNIIVFIIDDWRWDSLGCAGNDIIRTLVMDELAKSGVYFSHAFADVPSNISHAGIYTGIHARTHGHNWDTGPLLHAYTDASYPQLLREAGYRTGFIGKFPVGTEYGVRDRMFDSFEIVPRNPYMIEVGGKIRQSSQYMADKALKFLEGHEKNKPFSLTIAFNDAHSDDNAYRQYWWTPETDQLYKDVHIPELTTPTADPSFYASLPGFLYTHFDRTRWWQRYCTPERYQDMVKAYYRIITGVDMAVGRVIEELKKQQLDKKTIIFIVGENGNFLGERGFGGKYLMYDISIRTPFIIHNPKAPVSQRGIVIDDMVLNLDIAPTIFAYAGIESPGLLDGSSLIPLMAGKQAAWRKGFLCQHLSQVCPAIVPTEGYRTERWKYIRYPDFPDNDELYDLVNDPDEAVNLATHREYQVNYVEMRNLCDEAIANALRNKKNTGRIPTGSRGY